MLEQLLKGSNLKQVSYDVRGKKSGNQDLTSMDTEQQATVIIPCFNVEAYIIDCLDSVELQGDSVYHTYIVDNNCTDHTIAMVREWQEAHPAFSLTIAKETTPGAPAARNHPLSLVKTKWVQFLDADDVLLANKIADQIKRFPDTDVICAGGTHVTIDGRERQSIPETNIPLALMKGQAGITSSNLFSTSSVQAVQGWDESLQSSQEYDLMFRLWHSERDFSVDILPRALIRERSSGQISHRNPREKWVQLIELRLQMLTAFTTKKSIDSLHLQKCYQSLFDCLRTLAKYDLHTAIKYHEAHLKSINFNAKPNETSSAAYCIIYNLVGFNIAERIKKMSAKIHSIVPATK